MKYYDEKKQVWRFCLDKFMLPGEKSYEDVYHSGDHCKHMWESCVHEGLDSFGSNTDCLQISPFIVYDHYICIFCGKERWLDRWGDATNKILEARRSQYEKEEI